MNNIVLNLPFNATDYESAILPQSVYVQYDALRLELGQERQSRRVGLKTRAVDESDVDLSSHVASTGDDHDITQMLDCSLSLHQQ